MTETEKIEIVEQLFEEMDSVQWIDDKIWVLKPEE